jgi:microsomal dipeptidase-like Zn-dependent dipeptidase
MTIRSITLTVLGSLFALLAVTLVLSGWYIYRWTDIAVMAPPYRTSAAARQLHDTLLIADMHADSASSLVDFSKPQPYGHIGADRLEAGNLSLLTLALPTEVSMIFNFQGDRIRGFNPLAFGAMVNGWPVRTWGSNYERGRFFLQHVQRVVAEHRDRMFFVRDREDLDRLRRAYAARPPHPLGILLAVEGIHILDGDLSRLPALIDSGVRMISLTHDFDNEAAGSNTGAGHPGLTEFGRQALRIMEQRGVLVDLAHSSEATISDVLRMTGKPVVFSHTGVKATCNKHRNISDDAIRGLGANGGVIGVAFFTSALCGTDVGAIVSVMRHIRDLIGTEHIALGSDYDGMVRVVFDVGGLPLLTEALLKNGFTPDEVRAIMGENYLRVLGQVLPEAPAARAPAH